MSLLGISLPDVACTRLPTGAPELSAAAPDRQATLAIAVVDGLAPRLLIVVAIFVPQMALAAWWQRHHAYCPVEWLLRAP